MRYLLFTYEKYYPGGGWQDFIGEYASLEEAKLAANSHEILQFAEIVDLETMSIVLEGNGDDGKFGRLPAYEWSTPDSIEVS